MTNKNEQYISVTYVFLAVIFIKYYILNDIVNSS